MFDESKKCLNETIGRVHREYSQVLIDERAGYFARFRQDFRQTKPWDPEPKVHVAIFLSAFLGLVDGGPWETPNAGGISGVVDLDRDRRLRVDECAMLGGLLCDLLGVNRWAISDGALASQPILSGSYALTGHRKRDAALSAILNRAWAGDAGGALGWARGTRRPLEGYDDALTLLKDVERCSGKSGTVS